jgi:hypothetical protein
MRDKTDAQLDRDPMPTCAFCEHAEAMDEHEHFIFCTRKKQAMPDSEKCRHYTYDLLKRTPLRIPFTSMFSPDFI